MDSRLPPRAASTWKIVVGLLSLHYGIGFVLGTGEQTYIYGVSGAAYAVAAAVGLLGISVLASFYWRVREPIWDLLGNRFGDHIRYLSNSLSWIWMIGVMAGQMLGAGYALGVLGIPVLPSIISIGILIALLGPLPLERVAWLFAGLLFLSTIAVLISLAGMGGISIYWQTINNFIPAVVSGDVLRILGVVVTTFLLTIIGMDFQQVLISGRNENSAVIGSITAGLVLLPIAFLPSAVTLAALQSGIVSAGSINGKDIIPLILAHFGDRIFPFGGLVLTVALILLALGSGSGLNRALIRSFQSATFMPKSMQRPLVSSWINAIVALAIAMTGTTIVSLMVTFYAIYVAGVFVPFVAYLLDRSGLVRFTSRAISLGCWAGCITALLVYLVSIVSRGFHLSILNWLVSASEMWMILIGLLASAFFLCAINKPMKSEEHL